MNWQLKNKHVKVFLRNKFKFEGIVREDGEEFLTLDDKVDGVTRLFTKHEITIVEVLR